jgi:hypothetical protein
VLAALLTFLLGGQNDRVPSSDKTFMIPEYNGRNANSSV